MTPTHRKLLGTLGLAIVSGSILITSVSGASQSAGEADSNTAQQTSVTVEAQSDVQALAGLAQAAAHDNDTDLDDFDLDDLDLGDLDLGDFEVEEWEPTPEDIAEINEWVNAEKDALDNAGINYTTETDEHGINYLEWNETDDEAAWAALDTLYETLFDIYEIEDWDNFDDFDDFDVDDFDVEEWEPTPEDIAEINEWVNAEKDALDNAGINYTTETDEHGINYLEWNETDDEAAWAALDTLYETLFDTFEIEDWDNFDDFDDFDVDDLDDFDIEDFNGPENSGESDD